MGTIYRFVTRTVLHNFVGGIKSSGSIIGKLRKSVTYTLLALIIAILLTVLFVSNMDPNSGFIFDIVFMVSIIICDFLLVYNLTYLFIERWDDNSENYEPKFVMKICSTIGDFCKDIFRPNDEQEELEKKRRKEVKEKKLEVKKIKLEDKKKKLEMKNAEENKFNRFEVMEID